VSWPASIVFSDTTHYGILEERKVGREKLFVHPELLNLLSDDGPPG